MMKVEPQDAFMLPANSLQELHVGIRPMSVSACSQLMYINVVDVELHQVSHAVHSSLIALLSAFIHSSICSSSLHPLFNIIIKKLAVYNTF